MNPIIITQTVMDWHRKRCPRILRPKLERMGYRLRYYWRKLVNFVGLCHRCGGIVNYTRSGKAICPKCGR